MNKDKPDLNDALDMLYGTRKALGGILNLLAITNSSALAVEEMDQLLQTLDIRLNMCEKVMKKAVEIRNEA